MRRRFRLGIGLLAVLGAGYLWLVFAGRTPPEALPNRALPDTLAAQVLGAPVAPEGFTSGRAAFSVLREDLRLPYAQMSFSAQPEESAILRAEGALLPLTVETSGGVAIASGANVTWQAPQTPGPYRLSLRDARGARVELTGLVHEPFDVRATTLNGYDIGRYPRTTYQGNPRYAPPTGFIPIRTETDRSVPVSPHFVLGQFLCKQPSGYPKYLLVDARLLVKLEHLLERVNEAGYDVETLFVMSAYRTPQYNAAIGNETTFSAHLYGLAADVFVDADEDGTMDDLDGDGQITTEDARVLFRLAEPLDTLYNGALAGGLGLYAPAPHRGPFIHVDVRGTPVRW